MTERLCVCSRARVADERGICCQHFSQIVTLTLLFLSFLTADSRTWFRFRNGTHTPFFGV